MKNHQHDSTLPTNSTADPSLWKTDSFQRQPAQAPPHRGLPQLGCLCQAPKVFCFRIPNPRDALLTPHLPEALHVTLTHRQLAYPAASDSKSTNDAFFSVHRGSHFGTDLKTYEHQSIKNLVLAEAPGTHAILHSYPRRESRLVHGLPQPRSYELHRVEARVLLQTQWESCGERKKKKKSHFSQEVTEKAGVIYHTVTCTDFKD